MRDQLRALVKLAEIDASAHDIEEKLEGIPAELEERRVAIQGLEALVEGQRAKMAEAEKLAAAQDEELRQRSETLSRSKAKGARARTMREVEAAERELEAIRAATREAEDERLRLQEMIEQTGTILGAPVAELESQRAALDEARSKSEGQLAELRTARDQALQGREDWAKRIDKPIFRRYERLRVKIHPLVVPVVDATCTGCRMRLPAQLTIEIAAGKDTFQCPTCQRFLYDEAFIADE